MSEWLFIKVQLGSNPLRSQKLQGIVSSPCWDPPRSRENSPTPGWWWGVAETLHERHRLPGGHTPGQLGASCPRSRPPSLTAAVLRPWRGQAGVVPSQVKRMASEGGTLWAKAGTGGGPGVCWHVSLQPVAQPAITVGLEHQTRIVSQFWRPRVQDQRRCQQGYFLLRLGGQVCSRPLPQCLLVCRRSLMLAGLQQESAASGLWTGTSCQISSCVRLE